MDAQVVEKLQERIPLGFQKAERISVRSDIESNTKEKYVQSPINIPISSLRNGKDPSKMGIL